MFLFLVTPCLAVGVQPCTEWIPIFKKSMMTSLLKFLKKILICYVQGEYWYQLNVKNVKFPWCCPSRSPSCFLKHSCLSTPRLVLCNNFICNSTFQSLINADFFTSRIGPGDTFLIFWCRYIPVVAFVQYFMTNIVVLVCQSNQGEIFILNICMFIKEKCLF